MGLQINLGLQQLLIVLVVPLPLGLHPSPLGDVILTRSGSRDTGYGVLNDTTSGEGR